MILLELLIALGLLQGWGAGNPLHRDGWFHSWLARLSQLQAMSLYPWLHVCIGLLVPVLLVTVAWLLLPEILAFVVAIVVLLYSLGRGEFGAGLGGYVDASNANAWDDSIAYAQGQGIDCDAISKNDWPRLHEQMLEATAYQGFERLFAVLFWFIILGPLGALLYRLSFLYSQRYPGPVAHDWLWTLEWPAARVLGFSFAITGNFVGCINRWKGELSNLQTRTGKVIMQSALGALSVDDELVHSCDVTQRELYAIRRLYARTLWFWLSCLAIWVLLV